MFTVADVDEANIRSPAVPGCDCTYCANFRLYKHAVGGHGSQPSHRLAGGNEHHNPENRARLALRDSVSEEQFKMYTSRPGGHYMWFQGPSGLWYTSGRNATLPGGLAGHHVYCYGEHRADNRNGIIAVLSVPPADLSIPLGDIVLMHYLVFTTEELKAWQSGKVTVLPDYSGKFPVGIPDELRGYMRELGINA